MKVNTLLLELLLLLVVFAPELDAQTTSSGALAGVVSDPTQAVVPPAVLLPPAVERLHCDLGFLARLWGGFSVGDAYFNLTQHRHEGGFVPNPEAAAPLNPNISALPVDPNSAAQICTVHPAFLRSV